MTFTFHNRVGNDMYVVSTAGNRCWYVCINPYDIKEAILELGSVGSGWTANNTVGESICTFTDWDDLSQQLTTNYPELLI
jgi:hypothetical protein